MANKKISELTPTTTVNNTDLFAMVQAGETKCIEAQYIATPDASTTVKGKIEIATQTEVDTGTDATRAVTPATLANWIGSGKQWQSQAFTSSGSTNFTTPANITTSTVFKVTIVGAGGGGGGTNSATGAAGGGGAGGTAIWIGSGLSPSTNYTVIVGAGGAGGGATVTGTTGGNSSFNNGSITITGNGGTGGIGSSGAAGALGGTGGTTTNATYSFQGGDGGYGTVAAASGQGGSSSCGGGGGGKATVGGNVGRAPGSGGGGNYGASSTGGTGANGIVIIEWVG